MPRSVPARSALTKRPPVGGAGPSSAGPPHRRHVAAVTAPIATPRAAASTASARQRSSPSRPNRASQLIPAAHGPGHRDRAWPVGRDRQRGRRVTRRRAGRVEAVRLGPVPDDREQVAAHPGRHRLGDAQHRRGRDRRVDRIAARIERAEPGEGGERLARRHHGLGRDSGRAGGGDAEPVHAYAISARPWRSTATPSTAVSNAYAASSRSRQIEVVSSWPGRTG